MSECPRCPECGAAKNRQWLPHGGMEFGCGSLLQAANPGGELEFSGSTHKCLRNQLTAAQARIAELEEKNERLEAGIVDAIMTLDSNCFGTQLVVDAISPALFGLRTLMYPATNSGPAVEGGDDV